MMKRLMDLLVASMALAFLWPLILLTAIVVRLRMGSPILFSQLRPGYQGVPFRMYKFRTMLDSKDASGNSLPDEQRMTKLGNFLRKASLDELPGLWNVLRGEMSLVGPRPLMMAYLERYTPEQRRRHEVKPGVTGWAQINGRNSISWEEKFALDVWYVDNQSLLLDLRIMWMTLWTVLFRRGISASDHVTMPEYFGPDDKRADNCE